MGKAFSIVFSATLVAAGTACAPSSDLPEHAETEDVEEAFRAPVQLENRVAGLTPLLPSDAVEIVAELPRPPGNVAVAPDGRVFFSFHPEGNLGGDVSVAELVGGEVVPYPNEAFQKTADTILSLRVDTHGRLWTLDYGHYGMSKPRLVAIDLASDEVVIDYTFPRSAAPVGSMLNDFQVSPTGDAVYISDQSTLKQKQALVVVDFSGPNPIARRRLVEHPSVDNGAYDVFVHDELVTVAGFFKPDYGVDAITFDQNREYLYFGALNSGELFRVPAKHLEYEESLMLDDELALHVEKVADTTMTDGAATDRAGHVYLTDMEHSAIVRVAPSGELEVLAQSELLRWPDGLSWAPDGSLYVTASALHEYLPELIRSRWDIERGAPYHILRIVPGDACDASQDCTGTPGH